jgi:hypothetical protein
MRLILVLAIAYIGFKMLKVFLKKSVVFKDISSSASATFNRTAGQIDDVMVQCPFCQVYFPKRDGIHVKIKGEDLFFCSDACKKNYLHKKGDEHK